MSTHFLGWILQEVSLLGIWFSDVYVGVRRENSSAVWEVSLGESGRSLNGSGGISGQDQVISVVWLGPDKLSGWWVSGWAG